jgi:hypothetical protein
VKWDQGKPAIERMLADGELRQFNRMRTRRHDAEYPPADAPEITASDVQEAQTTAVSLIDLAARVLDEMSPC